MDRYLSRCLKNWVASQPQINGDRQLLLNKASAPYFPDEKLYALVLRILTPRIVNNPRQEFFTIPFTQTQLWSFHFALNYRNTI